MKNRIKVTTEQAIKLTYPLNGDVIISIKSEQSTIKKNKYHLIFFLFNIYRAKPTTEQSDKTIATPYLNRGNFNKGYCMLNKPIITKTNSGKRNVITKNNMKNLTFIRYILKHATVKFCAN